MTGIDITLAVEDLLSEVVARKILYQSGKDFRVTNCLCKGGYGYLKTRINNFNNASKICPFFVLTDQDEGCPPDKIKRWLHHKPSPNLIFRIAVMEIESWVMAHREAFAKFLSIPVAKLPVKMDELSNPKQYLISLAKKSRSKTIIEDIVPGPGSTAQIGPNYNARLSKFIRISWDVHKAINSSESLYRAFQRIQEFKQINRI
jgi:hypothetical protein